MSSVLKKADKLDLSLSLSLAQSIEVVNEDVVEQRRKVMLQLDLSDQKVYCLRCTFY